MSYLSVSSWFCFSGEPRLIQLILRFCTVNTSLAHLCLKFRCCSCTAVWLQGWGWTGCRGPPHVLWKFNKLMK